MEFLEKIGDWITTATAWVENLLRVVFGSANDRGIKQIGFVRNRDEDVRVPGSLLDRVHQLEPEYEKLSDGELKGMSDTLRAKLADGKTLDDIEPEAFAAVREAGKRVLKMRHYDVQLVGGHILHKGKIAEMVTGEGKTLVATLPTYLNALAGKVHVVTVNDYLALRDMEWMGPLHMELGLTIGAIQSNMDNVARKAAYQCDITYGTSSEFGFDYLRDNMKPSRDLQVQGNLNYALVDEIDNILIDEARTPLIIAGPAHADVSQYKKANQVAKQLKRDIHFEVKEKEHTCHMTDAGVREAEKLAGVDSFYTAGNMEWPHLIDNALRAQNLFVNDVDYVVERGEVVIIDETTGRKMDGRQWSDGLHQAVEAKENVKIKEPTQTYATITLQNYFKLYNKLAGMTGTAMTEANEFWKIYKLDVVAVPTNRKMQRMNHPDVIYRTEPEKWDAVLEEVRRVHETKRPILVGTVSIEKSELLSKKLTRHGVKHEVLNAKQHEREADIISQAGRLNAVTIATNMAGRGTDIILGGNPEHMTWEELKHTYGSRLEIPKSEWDDYTKMVSTREGMDTEGEEVRQAGGLHVVGTERHDARRIDLQLRGRAGRQGDPGESRFFLSFEDPLLRKFAGETVQKIMAMTMKEGEAIESSMFTKQVEKAQKRREEQTFQQRKNLLEYDEVMDEQRKRIYSYRQQILDGVNCRDLISEMLSQQVREHTGQFMESNYRWETVAAWANQEFGVQFSEYDIQNMERDQLEEWIRDQALRQAEEKAREQIEEAIPEGAEKSEWNWAALARWANNSYQLEVDEKQLRKLDRDDLLRELCRQAEGAIQKYNLTPLDSFLADDFPFRSLAGWLRHQYKLEIDPQELVGLEPDAVEELLIEKVQTVYRDQEIRFPVSVGLSRFFSTTGQGSDRDGLDRWSQVRFEQDQLNGDFSSLSRVKIEEVLLEKSRQFLGKGDVIKDVDSQLDKIFGAGGERATVPIGTPGALPEVSKNQKYTTDGTRLPELVEWANQNFAGELKVEDLQGADRRQMRQTILNSYDQKFRPELSHTERAIVLDLLDTAWKEHLYFMDHLRASIGLVGYEQKDPKVEYKRQGMKEFEVMWSRVGERITSTIFRVEEQSDFTGSLWNITGAIHEDASDAGYQEISDGDDNYTTSGGGEDQPVESFKNTKVKIGRNSPCPCGSGKKYKKCCGAN